MDDWRSYDDVAETYARIHAPRLAEPAGDLVSLTGIETGWRVLDVGTGTGVAAFAAAGAGARVYGIDEAIGMLRVARTANGTFPVATAEANLRAARSEVPLTREGTHAQIEQARASVQVAMVGVKSAESAVDESRARLEARRSATGSSSRRRWSAPPRARSAATNAKVRAVASADRSPAKSTT